MVGMFEESPWAEEWEADGQTPDGRQDIGKWLLYLILGGGSSHISMEQGIQDAEHSLPHHAGQSTDLGSGR